MDSLSTIFINLLKKDSRHISGIYYQLFEIKKSENKNSLEENLEWLRESYEGKYGNDYQEFWFTHFHKSIRQSDFFTECYQKSHYDLLTAEERKELKKLRYKFTVLPKTKEEQEELKKGTDTIYNDEYCRYLDLYQKSRRENSDVSINGRLDGILYTTIASDQQNVLYELLQTAFKTFKVYQS